MKRLFYLSVVLCGVLLLSCKEDPVTVDTYQYEATVVGRGSDCGDLFTIALKRIDTDTTFEDGTYYADNLSADFQEAGVKLYINARVPNDDELVACTTMGPAYPHLFITKSKKAQD